VNAFINCRRMSPREINNHVRDGATVYVHFGSAGEPMSTHRVTQARTRQKRDELLVNGEWLNASDARGFAIEIGGNR